MGKEESETAVKPKNKKTTKSIFKITALKLPTIVELICILLLISVVLIKGSTIIGYHPSRIVTASTLMDTVDIDELSTAEFIYRGIAEAYKDEEHKNILCHIRYNATVKAGISMSDIKFQVDDENKTVKVTLPTIHLTVYIDDENSLDYMPENPKNISLREILQICEKDAEEEALSSTELMESAKESLQSTINGLLYPLLVSHQYTLEWN